VQPALFHPKALETIQSFPKPARHAMGEAILELQKGLRLTMPLSRAMPSIGKGVHELRIRDAAGIYRAFYLLRSDRGVVVFHAFEKRTMKTPPHEIKLGRKRLQEMAI
jgi:phage-related protein